ncbi:MAG: RNA-guided endonuclease TnpB family protein, partial [Thermoplasmata archaeon]
INVIIEDESHTSKCSFLDNESIEHHDEYTGKRIKRGIFRSADGIEGIGLYPRSLSIPEFTGMITSKGGC